LEQKNKKVLNVSARLKEQEALLLEKIGQVATTQAKKELSLVNGSTKTIHAHSSS
jgi:hypothetical protein